MLNEAQTLMRDEGYQVIVSTHNHDEADFLVRKCPRANLPVRKVELLSLGPSVSDIAVEIVDYNLMKPRRWNSTACSISSANEARSPSMISRE
jgi:hypothetical protein